MVLVIAIDWWAHAGTFAHGFDSHPAAEAFKAALGCLLKYIFVQVLFEAVMLVLHLVENLLVTFLRFLV